MITVEQPVPNARRERESVHTRSTTSQQDYSRYPSVTSPSGAARTSSFSSRHPEDVECSPKLGCDFIELGGRDSQLAVGLFQTKGVLPGFVAAYC